MWRWQFYRYFMYLVEQKQKYQVFSEDLKPNCPPKKHCILSNVLYSFGFTSDVWAAAGTIAGCVVDKKTPSHEPAWREELIQVLSASDHINRPPVTKLPTGYCTAMNCLPVNCIILHQKFSFWGAGMGPNFFRSNKLNWIKISPCETWVQWYWLASNDWMSSVNQEQVCSKTRKEDKKCHKDQNQDSPRKISHHQTIPGVWLCVCREIKAWKGSTHAVEWKGYC